MGYLFGFSGRFRRVDWWLAQLFVVSVLVLTLAWVIRDLSPYAVKSSYGRSAFLRQHGWSVLPPVLLCIWVGLAATVKRYHDRDKSGWWVLISVVPYVGQLWQFVECGFLRGAPGGNRYGDGEDASTAFRRDLDETTPDARPRFAETAAEPAPPAAPSPQFAPVFGRRTR